MAFHNFVYQNVFCILSLITLSLANNEKYPEILSNDGGGLRWRDLSVSLPRHRQRHWHHWRRRQGGDEYILHPSSGFVRKGDLCGIIGPSGSGKSTLLAALSGTTRRASGKRLTGSVWLDESLSTDLKDDCNKELSKSFLSFSKGEIAILHQQDEFFSMLTPRETINLAAFLKLKLKRDSPLVEGIFDSLGLRDTATRRIGQPNGDMGGFSGCLSGGERRRLSVALELVTTPRIFLADEATTGLDSAQAYKVIKIIAKVAKDRNIPCICSIHQPRASIWKSLDSFILLAPGGKMLYMGKRANARTYFKKLGFNLPPETNPAEFLIDLVTIDTENPEQCSIDENRINYLADAFREYNKNSANDKNGRMIPPCVKYQNSSDDKQKNLSPRSYERIGALLLRSMRQNMRDLKVNLLRIGASVGLGTLFSQLFSTVKGSPSAKSVADRAALLSIGAINATMIVLMKTLNLFGKERSVVMKEQMGRQYSGFDYLFSKALAELPLEVVFSTMFAATLKYFTSLRTPFALLSAIYSAMAISGASFGFAVGSLTGNADEAMTIGVPLSVIFIAVGIINPSGVDVNAKTPFLVKCLQCISPIRLATEALLIAEFKGMEFDDGNLRIKDLPRMGGLALVQNGNQVLDALGLGDKSCEKLMKDLLLLSTGHLLISWFGLTFFGPKFVLPSEATIKGPVLQKSSMTKDS